MKDKLVKLLITIAHLSTKLASAAEDLDHIYDLLADKKFLDDLEKLTEKENADV